jgi:competence protein ComEA
MNRLIHAVLLVLTLAFSTSSALAAKDDAKPMSDKPAASSAGKSDSAASKSDSAAKSKAGAQIDINSATEDQLKTLPQIGEARASAIVKARPYARKDELVSKKVLTQKQYDGIKDQVIAKQGAGTGADKASSSGASSKAAGASSSASAGADKAGDKASDKAKKPEAGK